MLSQIMVVLVTALLSSLFTLIIGYFIIRKLIQERGEKTVKDVAERFKNEVGPELEERVAQGVRSGFASLPSREVLRDTTRNMAKTGADLVGDTLKPFLKATSSYRTTRDGRNRYSDDPLDPDIDD